MENKILELIAKHHNGKLDIKNEVYYLFIKDGFISLWYDQDEETIKLEIKMTTEEKTFVYFDKDISLGELMKNE